ncbi:MAG TPA: hypothetical protein VKZ45_11335 [Vicingaceae bacterium]|nr:hypothetical protein [Vicingaceae bacterium]
MLGVFSCQKEDDSFIKQEHTSHTSKTKYSITKIDYQTVQQNNCLVNSITKIKEQTGTKGSSTQNRLVHSSAYGFYIDTDVATYMENANGSYHSYTFLVIRDNPAVALENLLFSLQEDGTYTVSIVSYDITESEREALLNRQYVDLTNKIFKEDIDGIGLMSEVLSAIPTTFYTSEVCTCNTAGHDNGIDPETGAPCPCHGIQISITSGTEENTEGNGPEEFPDNNEIPDGENNPGGGVPNNPNNPKPKKDATSPTVSIPFDQQVANCLSEYAFNGNTSIQTWLNSASFGEIKALASYLGKGDNCSNPATLDFVVEAIEAMINNNELELDFLEQIYLPLDKECQAKVVMDFTANVDSQLSNFLVNVFNGNNNFHIEIVDEDFPANITGNAATTPPVGMEFTSETAAIVRFDNEYLDNATDLSVVMTTAHEYLHVYLIYLYSQGQLLSTYPSYIDLNNAFQVFESNPNETTFQELENQSHIIYDDFLGWIQDSVNAYVEKNNLNISQEYIEKMVVGSHQYTSTFQNLSNTLQIEYSQIAVNEQNGETNANGSTCN